FFSSRRRHTRWPRDWSSDVCSSDLQLEEWQREPLRRTADQSSAVLNGRELAKFKGEPEQKFSGNNDETFTNFDSKKWNDTVKQLDQVMTELERLVETVDDKKLQAWASEIAHIGTHNAYHVGQIIFVRKLQGSWNPEKGVK